MAKPTRSSTLPSRSQRNQLDQFDVLLGWGTVTVNTCVNDAGGDCVHRDSTWAKLIGQCLASER